MTQVTAWSSPNRKGEWEHHHLEEGHSDRNAPVPMNKNQRKAWNNKKWEKQHGILENGKFCPKN